MINKQLSVLQGSKARGETRPDNGKKYDASNPITGMFDRTFDEAASFLPSELTGNETQFQTALSGMAKPSTMSDPKVQSAVLGALRAVTMGLTEPIAGPQPGPWTDAYKRPMEQTKRYVPEGATFDQAGQVGMRDVPTFEGAKPQAGYSYRSMPVLTPQQQGAATKVIQGTKTSVLSPKISTESLKDIFDYYGKPPKGMATFRTLAQDALDMAVKKGASADNLAQVGYDDIIESLLDDPRYASWFEKSYPGNEFNLRQDLEQIVADALDGASPIR